MMASNGTPSFLYLKGRAIVRFGRRRRAFVKMYDSCRRKTSEHGVRLLERERVCLEVLKDFAVPRLVELPEGTLRRELGFEPAAHVAQSFVLGKPLHKAGLTPAELLGAWMFLTEQLVAFRRHQILYTDLKPANVMARKTPLSLTQIDFDRAAVASEDGMYSGSEFGYTAGYEAPEHGKHARLGESAVVFQLGMLLANSWMGLDNSSVRDSKKLGSLRERVRKVGNGQLAKLVADCLAFDPKKRPSGYEEVLERLKAARRRSKNKKAFTVWSALRRSVAEPLAGVDLVL